METLFHSTSNSWITPVVLTVLAWAVMTTVVHRNFTVPQFLVKVSEILLVASMITLALVAWMLWFTL